MQIETDSAVALNLCLASLGIYLFVTSTEMLSRRHALSEGLLSWRYSRLRNKWLVVGPTGRLLELLLNDKSICWLLGLRFLSALVLTGNLAVALYSNLIIIAIYAAAITSLLLSLRHAYGGDGADQFSTIALVAIAISIPFGTKGNQVALGFIAFQCLLAYATAGLAKCSSLRWRDGSGLAELMNTKTYGIRLLGAAFRDCRLLAVVSSWAIILFQIIMPLLFLAGPSPLRVGLLCGLVFHCAMAFIMRLHTFVWAFVSAYPALIWVRMQIP